MGKTKILLDTNILISAFGWGGKPRIIFKLILDNQVELVTSPQLISELKKVLDYQKFGFPNDLKKKVIDLILEVSTIVSPKIRVNIIKDDPSDNRILEAALCGSADFIITGDKHLLNLKEYTGMKIVTAAEFIELVRLC
jgi:putative PIN family toxin of toxin-antitoxin system